ncbi:L,D-transpeptidase family protein [Clostridium sp. MSJ-11]|uniref:L,D-transpeptidase family protein n=1 Tax=Clostridium mobile TaxID=2841512 RepID=A0ABS6EH70_9CLOT|nr:L,D-transpeptidase family protein [Clostridium mobile]MBU5484561.1 L,D-transpeptidase family protein [Clostridium mobile]
MKLHRRFIVMLLFLMLLFSSKEVKAHNPKDKQIKKSKAGYNILVDISNFRMYLIDKENNEPVKMYPIAGGKPETPSPYGTWKIISKSANWGAGFGTRWMELNVPWGTYGIHGTNKPLTINNPDSQGCIRMFNNDVEEVYRLVDRGTLVVIYGGPYNMYWNIFRKLKPGDKGADVLEVQRTLQDRGYYTGTLDGIYGEGMKDQVLKFKKDSKLQFTHYIDEDMYKTLGMEPFE